MTQRQLADLADVSIDVIRKIEQGQRLSVRLDTLGAIAQALDVSTSELLDKPRGLVVGAEDGEMLHLRRAILDVIPMTTDPSSLADLRVQLGESWRAYWTGQYAACARRLPAVIVGSRAAVRADMGTTALTVQADVLHLAASLLAHLGMEDLAALAMHQATTAADASEDDLMIAGLAGSRAWLLMRQGLSAEGAEVAIAAAGEIEPRMAAHVNHVAVWGECLRYATVALTRAGQAAEARGLVVLTNTAAARVGAERPDRAWSVRVAEKAEGNAPLPGLGFGPLLTAVAEVEVEVADEQYRQALNLAARIGSLDALSPAVRAGHLINVAWAQTMDYHSADAVMTLRQAERIAPELVPYQTLVRQAVAELLPRRRTQRLPGLVGLAERAGVSVG
jgi:transcriptional regulator with XRE-family HTH domain